VRVDADDDDAWLHATTTALAAVTDTRHVGESDSGTVPSPPSNPTRPRGGESGLAAKGEVTQDMQGTQGTQGMQGSQVHASGVSIAERCGAPVRDLMAALATLHGATADVAALVPTAHVTDRVSDLIEVRCLMCLMCLMSLMSLMSLTWPPSCPRPKSPTASRISSRLPLFFSFCFINLLLTLFRVCFVLFCFVLFCFVMFCFFLLFF
jgi:hypothetical protein